MSEKYNLAPATAAMAAAAASVLLAFRGVATQTRIRLRLSNPYATQSSSGHSTLQKIKLKQMGVFKIKSPNSRRLRGRNTGGNTPEAEVSDRANNNEVGLFRKKTGGEGARNLTETCPLFCPQFY